MKKLGTIKDNFYQIYAIVDKNIKLQLRFKLALIFSLVTPIISIFLPIIILGKLFENNLRFGPWNSSNYLIFIFISYTILLLQKIIGMFPSQFRQEKFWQTLPAMIIAPFNRFNLLFGIALSYLIVMAIPFTAFLILSYVFFPINFLTFLLVIAIYLLIVLIFGGIGLIFGIFAISRENLWSLLSFLLTFVFWFSCISYPFELFPGLIQNIINLNPLYYIFDILRLTWIENDIIITFTSHYPNFIVLIISAIILPSIGVLIFNLIYKKYGIVGY
ncbi:MAG: ABC transporter permease [Promethearchaeota archaeon]